MEGCRPPHILVLRIQYRGMPNFRHAAPCFTCKLEKINLGEGYFNSKWILVLGEILAVTAFDMDGSNCDELLMKFREKTRRMREGGASCRRVSFWV